MWKTNLSTFDSWSFRWESTQELWFVLVEEDELPFLCLRSGVNQASVGKVPFTTMTERRSRAMVSPASQQLIILSKDSKMG
ncbi:Small ribosomal subunit protein [Trichinella pseudospiralis]